ncbi:hypothetical protein QBK99_00895 [Corticibacterium sp. UT-5YL-CI-8]|nr:hypothetical protein [Tianweitania sp. UT-5YL-CI-8]
MPKRPNRPLAASAGAAADLPRRLFVWPLFSMMSQLVSDTAVLRLLPRSAEVLPDWDRVSPPTPAMQAALMEYLKAVDDDQLLGDMVRCLNSTHSGFRTLMLKTTSAR